MKVLLLSVHAIYKDDYANSNNKEGSDDNKGCAALGMKMARRIKGGN